MRQIISIGELIRERHMLELFDWNGIDTNRVTELWRCVKLLRQLITYILSSLLHLDRLANIWQLQTPIKVVCYQF